MVVTVMTGQRYTLSAWAGKGRRDIGRHRCRSHIGAGANDDFIRIDSAVDRDNSGGPTFDIDGNDIGVYAAIHAPGAAELRSIKGSSRPPDSQWYSDCRARRARRKIALRLQPQQHDWPS
jgi:hypothetical protein